MKEHKRKQSIWACLLAQSCPTLQLHRLLPAWFLCPVGFSRQECWRGLPFPTPGNLPEPGIEHLSPASSALAGGFFSTVLPGEPKASWEKVRNKEESIWDEILVLPLANCVISVKSLNLCVQISLHFTWHWQEYYFKRFLSKLEELMPSAPLFTQP